MQLAQVAAREAGPRACMHTSPSSDNGQPTADSDDSGILHHRPALARVHSPQGRDHAGKLAGQGPDMLLSVRVRLTLHPMAALDHQGLSRGPCRLCGTMLHVCFCEELERHLAVAPRELPALRQFIELSDEAWLWHAPSRRSWSWVRPCAQVECGSPWQQHCACRALRQRGHGAQASSHSPDTGMH